MILLVGQTYRIDALSFRRHTYLSSLAQMLDFEKDLVPGKVRQVKRQIIELTTGRLSYCLDDSVSNGPVL